MRGKDGNLLVFCLSWLVWDIVFKLAGIFDDVVVGKFDVWRWIVCKAVFSIVFRTGEVFGDDVKLEDIDGALLRKSSKFMLLEGISFEDGFSILVFWASVGGGSLGLGADFKTCDRSINDNGRFEIKPFGLEFRDCWDKARFDNCEFDWLMVVASGVGSEFAKLPVCKLFVEADWQLADDTFECIEFRLNDWVLIVFENGNAVVPGDGIPDFRFCGGFSFDFLS